MNKKEAERKRINGIYVVLTLLAIGFTVVVISFVFSPNRPDPIHGFDFYFVIWPVVLGLGLAGTIPMGRVSIGAWKLNNIKERSNRRILTILLFLPTITFFMFLLTIMGLFLLTYFVYF